MGKPQAWVWIYFYIGMTQLLGLPQPTTADWVIDSQQRSTHQSFSGCKPKIKALAAPVQGQVVGVLVWYHLTMPSKRGNDKLMS